MMSRPRAALLFFGMVCLSSVAVGLEDGVAAPSDAPSLVPSDVPSSMPSDVPSNLPSVIPTVPRVLRSDASAPSPTLPLSDAPSLLPSDVPSLVPSVVPSAAAMDPASITSDVEAVACDGTTYWAYEPSRKAGTKIRQIQNDTIVCLAAPYNIKVLPCNATLAAGTTTLQVRLVKARGRQVVHQSGRQRKQPFFLYGPTAIQQGSAMPKRTSGRKQLPEGVYYVSVSRGNPWGRLVFTQRCPATAARKNGRRAGGTVVP